MHLIFRHVFNALSTVHMAAAAARVEDGLHGCIAYNRSALLVHAEMDGENVKNACTGTRWKLSSLQQPHQLFVTV